MVISACNGSFTRNGARGRVDGGAVFVNIVTLSMEEGRVEWVGMKREGSTR
jgi:hypothetical protein